MKDCCADSRIVIIDLCVENQNLKEENALLKARFDILINLAMEHPQLMEAFKQIKNNFQTP